jgi:hypothetical protein
MKTLQQLYNEGYKPMRYLKKEEWDKLSTDQQGNRVADLFMNIVKTTNIVIFEMKTLIVFFAK